MFKKISHDLVYSEDGATAAEYAIMASLIAAVIVAVVIALGIKVSGLFDSLHW